MLIGFIISLIVSIIILTAWIRWRKNKMNIFRRYRIPGPDPSLITGNINEFNKKRNKCFKEWIEKYGKIFGFFLGGKPCIICSDVDFLKIMQIKEFKNFSYKDMILPDIGIPHESIHNAIGLKGSEEWKNLRNIFNTSFSSGKIKSMTTFMSDPINQFLRIVDKKLGQPFEIQDVYKKLTFDITCRILFGVQCNIQNEDNSRFAQSLYQVLTTDTADILAGLSILFPELEPIPTKLRLAVDYIKNLMTVPCVRVIFNICQDIVESRKTSNVRPVDLLQNMIDAEDETMEERKRLSNDCVIANLVVFMIAGFDTMSNTLSWCAYYMGLHPEMQEKMREEINKNTDKSAEIQYSDLLKFQYMDQFLSETLRFFPFSSISVNRIGEKDFKYNDMIIPKNVPIMVPVPILHKDPNYWDNPEEFDPDRFSPENAGKIEQFAFQPFGAGPRYCIGTRLAHTIMKFILANLIRSYRIELYDNKVLKMEHNIFFSRPKEGIIVRIFPIYSE